MSFMGSLKHLYLLSSFQVIISGIKL